MEKYLESALKDQSLEKYHTQMDFLDEHNFNAPWLNRLEFRIGSETADISFDQYRLRLTPANPSEIKANKIYYKKQLQSINSEYQVALNKALENRYNLLLDHYYYFRITGILQQKQIVLDELIKSYSGGSLQGFSLNDLINLETDKSDILLNLSEIKLELKELEYYMLLDLDSGTVIDWGEEVLIPVDKIKEFVLQLELEEEAGNLFVLEAEQQYELRQQEFKVEMSEARRNIGYIQGNFDSDKGDEVSDRIGFQIGVRIPVVNPDKPDLNRDKFDLIEDQDDISAVEDLIKKRSELLLIRLNSLFDQFDLINNRIKSAAEINLLIAPDKGVNAGQLVRKKKYEIELMERKVKIEREIYEAYIGYLDIQGLLVKQPLINYLSGTFSTIEPK